MSVLERLAPEANPNGSRPGPSDDGLWPFLIVLRSAQAPLKRRDKINIVAMQRDTVAAITLTREITKTQGRSWRATPCHPGRTRRRRRSTAWNPLPAAPPDVVLIVRSRNFQKNLTPVLIVHFSTVVTN